MATLDDRHLLPPRHHRQLCSFFKIRPLVATKGPVCTNPLTFPLERLPHREEKKVFNPDVASRRPTNLTSAWRSQFHVHDTLQDTLSQPKYQQAVVAGSALQGTERILRPTICRSTLLQVIVSVPDKCRGSHLTRRVCQSDLGSAHKFRTQKNPFKMKTNWSRIALSQR